VVFQPDTSCELIYAPANPPLWPEQLGGYNCREVGSELSHLFNAPPPAGLGNPNNGGTGATGGTVGTGCSPNCFTQTGSFTNTQSAFYWTGTEYAPGVIPDLSLSDTVWAFFTKEGGRFVDGKDGGSPGFVWPVRPEQAIEVAIDISSLQLCTEDLSACTNAPRDYSIAARGDPTSDLGAAQCAMLEVEEGIIEEQDYLNPDGYLDLDAAFETSEVQDMLGTFCSDVKGATSEPLIITGTTLDGTTIFSVPVPNVGTDQLWKANK
jgi:hypothetical protein